MSYFIYSKSVLADPKLSSSDKLVYAGLCYYANTENGECWPGYQEIAARVNLSRETVRKSVNKLMDRSHISVIQRKKGKQFSSNLYSINYIKNKEWQKNIQKDIKDVANKTPRSTGKRRAIREWESANNINESKIINLT